MSNLIKFVSRPTSLSRLLRVTVIHNSVRPFGWLKSTKVERHPASVADVRISSSVMATHPTSVMVTTPLFTLDSHTDRIINLFANQKLREICKSIWKTDFNARRIYTLFYLKYHWNDNDPGLQSMAQSVKVYSQPKETLGYYLNHLLDSHHITIDEKRQIITTTLHDYDHIQPLIRISN